MLKNRIQIKDKDPAIKNSSAGEEEKLEIISLQKDKISNLETVIEFEKNKNAELALANKTLSEKIINLEKALAKTKSEVDKNLEKKSASKAIDIVSQNGLSKTDADDLATADESDKMTQKEAWEIHEKLSATDGIKADEFYEANKELLMS